MVVAVFDCVEEEDEGAAEAELGSFEELPSFFLLLSPLPPAAELDPPPAAAPLVVRAPGTSSPLIILSTRSLRHSR